MGGCAEPPRYENIHAVEYDIVLTLYIIFDYDREEKPGPEIELLNRLKQMTEKIRIVKSALDRFKGDRLPRGEFFINKEFLNRYFPSERGDYVEQLKIACESLDLDLIGIDIHDDSSSNFMVRKFMEENVESKTEVRSDGWKGYSESALKNYQHLRQVQGSPQKAHQLAPHIHRVFSNLKTWLNGTHHGVDPKYLQSYLDEFTFRFNRRQTPMAAFQTLLGISTQKSPLTMKTLSNRSQL